MNIDIGNINCDKCTGELNCCKYCTVHAGKALYNMLSCVETVETRIGEYSSRTRGGAQDLVVSGHQIHATSTPTWILTDISTTLDASPKLSSVLGKNSQQLLKEYGKEAKLDADELNGIINKLKNINSNKELIVPFKMNTKCIVDNKVATIDSIKWNTDRDTFKLKAKVIFTYPGASAKDYSVKNITDYTREFVMEQLDIVSKLAKADSNNIIQLTDCGIIKPIFITDNDKDGLAIDGTYLYSIKDGIIIIVGHWQDNKLVTNLDKKNKYFKKLAANLESIAIHKRYIAPYMMFETTDIKIK